MYEDAVLAFPRCACAVHELWQFVGRDCEGGEGAVPMLAYAFVLVLGRGLVGVYLRCDMPWCGEALVRAWREVVVFPPLLRAVSGPCGWSCGSL